LCSETFSNGLELLSQKMFETSNQRIVRVSEMPGPKKRALACPPHKKHSKKLALNSKNPFLPTVNNNNAIEEALDLLTTPDPEQNSFSFETPASQGLGAFAEKIGLGQSQGTTLDVCWTDLSAGDTTPEVTNLTPLNQDYAMPATEEDVSDFVVSPMEVEGRQFVQTEVQSTENVQFSDVDLADLEAFLTGEDLNEEMEVEEAPLLSVADKGFDLVEFAMGQSGLGEKEISDSCDSNIPVVVENTDTSNNDITKVEEIKMEPVENVIIEVIEERGRKRVGRPSEKTPITVTEIPAEGKLSDQEVKAMKYRRTRDLNNMASRRFRERKKKEKLEEQAELVSLRSYNMQLKQKYKEMETELAFWKSKVDGLNLL